MRKCDVRNEGHALAYVVDCTLATVCDLASKKSRSASEYNRQKSIAQTGIDWMRCMKVDFSTTRAQEVCDNFDGSVEAWAKQWDWK